jgi:hypothetical protein
MLTHVHADITEKALRKYFNKGQITAIIHGNIDSDSIAHYFDKVGEPYRKAQHFANVTVAEGVEFVKRAESIVVDEFVSASKSTGDEKTNNMLKGLYAMGRLFHAVQDFYSHTNWINLTGAKKVVWNGSAENPNVKNPENLKTCVFNIFTEVSDRLTGLTKKLKKPKTYKEFYLTGDKEVSHAVLSKDYEGSIADMVFKKVEGESGFNLASKDAIKHTKIEWLTLKRAVESSIGDNPENFFEDLSKWKPSKKEIKHSLKIGGENFRTKMSEMYRNS